MNKKGWFGKNEAGQSLAVLMLFLLGLLATAGLVLDGGNIFVRRRAMQNAADAAALAGARVLAFGWPTDHAAAAAREYAEERNGADSSDISFNAEGTEITVVTHKDTGMTFARLIGMHEVDVVARASASYASILFGGDTGPGVIAPITIRTCPPGESCWHVVPPEQLDEEHPDWLVSIWDDDTWEGPWDPYNLAGNNRGWLNMDCRGHPDYEGGQVLPEGVPRCATAGASLLTDWMLNGYDQTVNWDTHLWIRGDNGVKARPVAITAARVDTYMGVPLFDDVRCDDAHCPEPVCPGDAIQALYPGDTYYHIVALGCFYVKHVHATGNPKGIDGYFTTGCAFTGKPGDGSTGSPVRTFFLTE
jgi:hypothetical protein